MNQKIKERKKTLKKYREKEVEISTKTKECKVVKFSS